MVCVKVLKSEKQIIVSHVGSNDINDGTEYVLSWEWEIKCHFPKGYILLINDKSEITACVHFDMIEIE